MRKIPNFVLLRAFEAAARLQSFALAAISHQVKELEAYFGRPLFIRRNIAASIRPPRRCVYSTA